MILTFKFKATTNLKITDCTIKSTILILTSELNMNKPTTDIIGHRVTNFYILDISSFALVIICNLN